MTHKRYTENKSQHCIIRLKVIKLLCPIALKISEYLHLISVLMVE